MALLRRKIEAVLIVLVTVAVFAVSTAEGAQGTRTVGTSWSGRYGDVVCGADCSISWAHRMITTSKVASARIRESLFLQPDDTVRQDVNFASSTVWRGWEIQMSYNPYFYEGKVTSGMGVMEFRVNP